METTKKVNVYETDTSLNMYLGLHYPCYEKSSDEEEDKEVSLRQKTSILSHTNMPVHALRFPQRVAQLLVRLQPTQLERALDIGCAVGGSSLELACSFDQVDAFDYSQLFVQTARRIQAKEKVPYRIPIEADLYESVLAMPESHITAGIMSKVNYFVGDACKLIEMRQENKIGTYDGVIMANLLCRLPDPVACLKSLSKIVRPGGVVVIVTPFSWLEEFTSREKWLGGYYETDGIDGQKTPMQSKTVLKHYLQEVLDFDQIHEEEMPLIIREHQRKYQYIISEATGWRRRCTKK